MPRTITELIYYQRQRFPEKKLLPSPENTGICSLCKELTKVLPLRNVVSQSFTDWEPFTPPYNVCIPCAWVLSNKSIRLHSLLITNDLTVNPCPHEIMHLQNYTQVAIIAPVSKQKQLVHHARSGFITTDYGNFPLDSYYINLIKATVFLRRVGMNEKELKQINLTHNLPTKLFKNTTQVSTVFTVIHKIQEAQKLNPELFLTVIMLSRFTYCKDSPFCREEPYEDIP